GFPGNINPEKCVEDAVPCQRPRRAPAFHRPAVDSESPSKLVGRTRQANGILDQLRNRAPQLRELHLADLVVTHLRHRLRPRTPPFPHNSPPLSALPSTLKYPPAVE